jgi:hypothetical protein
MLAPLLAFTNVTSNYEPRPISRELCDFACRVWLPNLCSRQIASPQSPRSNGSILSFAYRDFMSREVGRPLTSLLLIPNSMLASDRWSTTFLDPTTQINSRVLTTLPLNSPSRESAKCWALATYPSQHWWLRSTPLVSFLAPTTRINSTLPLANLPKSEFSNSWICYHLSILTMDSFNDFETCLMHFPWNPTAVGPCNQI